MTTTVIPGLGQSAEGVMLQAVNALYHNNLTPILDNIGDPLLPTVQAAYADVAPTPTQILVAVEDGALQTFESGGLAGFDDNLKMWKHVAFLPDSRIVFTIDAPNPPLRRRLIDTLRWGLMTAYSIDANNVRTDSYLLGYLAAYGIHLQRNRPIFEAPEYDPPNLAAPRPNGLVFSARIKLRCDLEVVWWTPPGGVPGITIAMAPAGNGPNSIYLAPL